MIHGKKKDEWLLPFPLLRDLMELRETQWFNPGICAAAEGLRHVGLDATDVADASSRLQRFAPYIAKVFPETESSGGILESPLFPIPRMKDALCERYGGSLPGALWLKADSHLPISGSIKARGGIYEVLKHAEHLALESGKISVEDDYSVLADPEWREFFTRYSVAVGSTGNLGLSIGIMSAQLGFKVTVHMSADARQWKKDLLRSKGVAVVEYAEDYSKAVEEGREQAKHDPSCHFVDDENSTHLFLGYAVAAERLRRQFDQQGIVVDASHPLFVYLPCGVGGGPGGVAFGLKLAFGDHVRCFFAEPTHAPCMFLGVYTGLHDGVSVRDFGIDGATAADGLAVSRPSGFVGKAMERLIDGYFTVSDEEMYALLSLLNETEGYKLEPSALAGMTGIVRVARADNAYHERIGLTLDKMAAATHIVWGTGGNMVPAAEMRAYLDKGDAVLGRTCSCGASCDRCGTAGKRDLAEAR